MKRLALVLAAASLLTFVPSAAGAHELIPKEVEAYIEQNPNATPEEIEQFVKGSAPELAEKSESQGELFRIVKGRDTNFFENTGDFIVLGIKHILSGPDHILFVLSLLLVFISLKEVLKLTAAFTVAHSTTLILAGASILTLSSDIVEPIIAFSISAVAIATVFFRKHKIIANNRAKLGLVFFFGLFHGLGFAGLLQEINVPDDKFLSSLLAFNVGIEIGQLFIISLALPLIYTLRDKRWYGGAIKATAATIGFIGIFWGVQRILGS